MKFLFLLTVFLLLGCKQLGDSTTQETNIDIEESPVIIPEKPELPEGAQMADFLGNQDSVYAYIRSVDTAKELTLIAFENNLLPNIIIPESVGAELHVLKLKNFKKDLLLVNAKLKDTNFNEYYLFVWNGSLWKQPVNRFDIHKSNMKDTLVPLSNNPKDSTELLRYYSVFDMDRESEKKFTWKLKQESVPIEK